MCDRDDGGHCCPDISRHLLSLLQTLVARHSAASPWWGFRFQGQHTASRWRCAIVCLRSGFEHLRLCSAFCLKRPIAPALRCLGVISKAGGAARRLDFSCVCAEQIPVASAVGTVLPYLISGGHVNRCRCRLLPCMLRRRSEPPGSICGDFLPDVHTVLERLVTEVKWGFTGEGLRAAWQGGCAAEVGMCFGMLARTWRRNMPAFSQNHCAEHRSSFQLTVMSCQSLLQLVSSVPTALCCAHLLDHQLAAACS